MVETNDTKTARSSTTKKRKSIAIDVDGEDEDRMDVDPPVTKAAKGKGKDDQDFTKLLAMIERCGVVITEVQTGTSRWPKSRIYVSLTAWQDFATAGMFNASTVESDTKRLLHPSASTVAMRESGQSALVLESRC